MSAKKEEDFWVRFREANRNGTPRPDFRTYSEAMIAKRAEVLRKIPDDSNFDCAAEAILERGGLFWLEALHRVLRERLKDQMEKRRNT